MTALAVTLAVQLIQAVELKMLAAAAVLLTQAVDVNQLPLAAVAVALHQAADANPLLLVVVAAVLLLHVELNRLVALAQAVVAKLHQAAVAKPAAASHVASHSWNCCVQPRLRRIA